MMLFVVSYIQYVVFYRYRYVVLNVFVAFGERIHSLDCIITITNALEARAKASDTINCETIGCTEPVIAESLL
jgi:hypothetical protein